MNSFFYKTKLICWPCQENTYRPLLLSGRFLIYYGLALLFLKLLIIPFFLYLPHTSFFADITKIELINLTNATRAQFNLPPLKENQLLNEAAYLKAQDMLNKNYFAHYSPEGLSPWYWFQKIGYQYRSAGENLAIGFFDSEQVHQAWLNSPSHRANLINPKYQDIGIAVVKGNFQGNETTLVVQLFGAPQVSLVKETPSIKTQPVAEEVKPQEQLIAGKEATNTSEKTTTLTEKEKQSIEKKELEEVIVEEVATESEREKAVVAGPITGEIVAAATVEKFKPTPVFVLFQFLTGKYYDWVQKIIYGSLVFIIFSLLVTIFYDLFVYRRFEIQYKDVIYKSLGFITLWFILVFLDKAIILELIAYNFRIG